MEYQLLKTLYRKDKLYHLPDNIAAVTVMVVFYKNLHDHYRFGRRRFPAIMELFGKAQYIKWDLLRKKLDSLDHDAGMDERLFKDFMNKVQKVATTDTTYREILGSKPISGNDERVNYRNSAEIAYKMFLIVLHETYGFTPGKIKNVQRYVKDDLICINEGRCKLTEFFEMLEEECGQEIRALQDWKAKYGSVHGPDGMPR